MSIFDRTISLIGKECLEKLKDSHVAVFGLGGVGGSCVEALVRCGIGKLTIIDSDKVDETNINRQIIATLDTVGQYKVDAMKSRIESINQECDITVFRKFVLPEEIDFFDFTKVDYVVDAIDTVSAKLAIIETAKTFNRRVISAMGAGNKLHPEMFFVDDISKTSVCPLARVMRRELAKRGISDVKCVYSKEPVAKGVGRVPACVSFVPPVAGFIMAGEVIRDLAGIK